MIPLMSSHSEPRLSESESLDCELLYLLEQNPDLSQRELSRHLGISLGRVNYCLKALAEKGWLKLENFHQSSAKHRYVCADPGRNCHAQRTGGAVLEAQTGAI